MEECCACQGCGKEDNLPKLSSDTGVVAAYIYALGLALSKDSPDELKHFRDICKAEAKKLEMSYMIPLIIGGMSDERLVEIQKEYNKNLKANKSTTNNTSGSEPHNQKDYGKSEEHN